MQIIRDSEELGAARLTRLRQAARRSRWCRPWARSTPGTWRWSPRRKRRADQVVATIFVNPMQFGADEDLDRYPRQEAADARDARGGRLRPAVAADGRATSIPTGFATTVSVAGRRERWEGEARPGHFDGVATVVAKLLLAVRPDVALFGEKDFQQLAVIRRMVADLGLGVEIVGVPTVRDADGLALSSRNAYLSADERQRALALPRALDSAARGDPVRRAGRRGARARRSSRSSTPGFSSIDYFALVDAGTLEPLDAAARRDAPDRRGDDRRHAADRQSRGRNGPFRTVIAALTICLRIGRLKLALNGTRGTSHGCHQSEGRGVPDPEPPCRRRARRCRCIVRAWRDLFDRPRRRRRST